ncbi:MAG: FAD-dependent oxidoreductase, partial [Ignavibacteriales bacterium]|nr:FAD-dependent oxidoreductase [Ignavibacteriales bacterium]
MPNYPFLIIGGGIAADSAIKGIRQTNTSDEICVISSEKNPPYNRPLLSKGLWKGEPIEKIWREINKDNVTVHLSKTAKSIDTHKQIVVDDTGTSYSFKKLLIATGGSVRRLPFDIDGIIYLRTLDDYQNLRMMTESGQSFAVIGGGFIGSEIAAALAINNKSVTMIFPEDGIGARVYPTPLSQFLNTFYQSKGVEVLAKDGVVSIVKKGLKYFVQTKSGRVLETDGVIAGIGIIPNVELAQAAGLKSENGVIVNEYLQTSHSDIYSAGDVANFYSPALGKRIRLEHEDNSNAMGEIAGKNMTGSSIPYHYLPTFYSDLFELGFEAVGELDSRFEIVENWKEQFREGIIYYLNENRVRGVLLWNVWGKIEAARELI